MRRREKGPTVLSLRPSGADDARSVERVASIDIGSNSIRAIVADVHASGAIRVVDEMKDAPRLGAGLEMSARLDPAAIRRAADAVARMAALARAHGASRIEAVATSAVREAGNADEFTELVRTEAELAVRVLEGHDEAMLGWRSALAHFDLGVGRWVVVDIGGGSLELALSVDGLVDRLVSLPLGALRLTERFLGAESSRRDVRALRKHARELLRKHLRARDWRGAHVIGSGGTFTNLAGMFLARQEVLTAQTVHGTHVPRVDLEHILDALQDTTLAERQRVPGLNAARADIIVAGLAVVAEVMARLDAHELTVSGYGIREGLLLETARVMPPVANPGEARERSVVRLAEACRYEEPHSTHVRRLALQLFDSLGGRLGCAPEDRQVLADAALLHDIGYHISYDRHHKHSYYLILHAELLGMSPAEQVVVANLARYHRGKVPRKSQRSFGALDKPTRQRIKRLAAILRVADGFDRGHVMSVDRIRVRWGERSIRLTPIPRNAEQNLRLELWGSSRKADLLAKLAGVPVEVVSPAGALATAEKARVSKRADAGG